MNYQSKHPEVRQILDRVRVQEWIEFEIEHISKLTNDKGAVEFLHHAMITGFPYQTWQDEVIAGGHEIERMLHHLSVRLPLTYHKYLHYGLTSSNVIDSCNHRRWKRLIGLLNSRLEDQHLPKDQLKQEVRGVTHGNCAHRTYLAKRYSSAMKDNTLELWIDPDLLSLSNYVNGGPTGGSYHRQAINRSDYWPIWTHLARVAFACEQMATDYRFYCSSLSEIVGVRGTLAPGVATTSSAMPGKVNPTVWERICSVGYMVRTMCTAQMLQPPKWLDADLVHSALERETIDRIWDHTFWMVEETFQLINSTTLEVIHPACQHTSHDALLEAQANGQWYFEARRFASNFPTG